MHLELSTDFGGIQNGTNEGIQDFRILKNVNWLVDIKKKDLTELLTYLMHVSS